MNRRKFIKNINGLGMGVILLPDPLLFSYPEQAEQYRLSRLKVSRELIKNVLVGLRPFRRSGFMVRADRLGEKLLIHNYGHGGCGVSLSWGTSKLAMGIAMESPHRDCAVIGCGAVGLATARLLQQAGWKVNIYAKDLPPNTTSDIAGAEWGVGSIAHEKSVHFRAQLESSKKFSFEYFKNMNGLKYGIKWRDYYSPAKNSASTSDKWDQYLMDFEVLKGRQSPFKTKAAYKYREMIIEPAIYLPALIQDFRNAGGKISIRDFKNKNEFQSLSEPVIMNCTGIGAKKLFDDKELTPIKGQLIILDNQGGIDYCMSGGRHFTYMFRRVNNIALGGTLELGNWDLSPNESAIDSMIRHHRSLGRHLKKKRN